MKNDIEKQREHFESIADSYIKSRKNTKHLTLKEIIWKEALSKIKIYDDSKAFKILEPMCGSCEGKTIIQNMLGISIDYTGFDYSETMIEESKKIYPEDKIFVQDVTKFALDEVFDIIILIGGLHHVPSYSESVVRNMYTCLRDGGYFISVEPTNNNFIIALIRRIIYRRNKLFDQDTERDFTLKELNSMFEDVGFKLEDQMYPGLLSYILWYNPDAFPLLNIGKENFVRAITNIEKIIWRTKFAKLFTFATWSIWKKGDD